MGSPLNTLATLQDSYTVTFTLEEITPVFIALITGDPQVVLWWEMSYLYDEFWWHER